MELNRNPFRYGADFDPNDVVGCKVEITRAVRAIRDRQRLFLIGPRGFGKTSILRAAQANLSQEGAIVLYVNAETSSGIATLVREIVAGTAAPSLRRCGERHSESRPILFSPGANV
jgi:uncharacterized protein